MVKRDVVALAALGLFFEWPKEVFCVAEQAPLSLRQLTGPELRIIVNKAGDLESQSNGTGDGVPPAIPACDVGRMDSTSFAKPPK